jgi:hypothetical protein
MKEGQGVESGTETKVGQESLTYCVPKPVSMFLFGAGLVGLAAIVRRWHMIY